MSQIVLTPEDIAEIASWRHDFHAHPEVLYDVHRTARRVRDLLESFGLDEVVTGIGGSGVVGVVHGIAQGPCIGIRAELDALPMPEETGLPYASDIPDRMHACGHDGHMAMALGAAKYLARTRKFTGSVVFIFQPAEEGGAGALAMVRDGLFDRWPISAVYALHNLPGHPLGKFLTRSGPLLASSGTFDITITGQGGHAAWPHLSADPVVAAGHVITGLQTIVARNADPLLSAVVSVTRMNAGSAYNIIPDTARLAGTLRTLDTHLRDLLEHRIRHLAQLTASAHGCKAEVSFTRVCDVVVNDSQLTTRARNIAIGLNGTNMVADIAPMMGGDDFAFFLERVPGAYLFIGNGNSSNLHTTTYDFNDGLIGIGAKYLISLAQS